MMVSETMEGLRAIESYCITLSSLFPYGLAGERLFGLIISPACALIF